MSPPAPDARTEEMTGEFEQHARALLGRRLGHRCGRGVGAAEAHDVERGVE